MDRFGMLISRTFFDSNKIKTNWPFVPGNYFVLNAEAHVAITTLGSIKLSEEINAVKPKNLCIVGKTETENVGIEKLVKNIVSNPSIEYLMIVGQDPPKHLSGESLIALHENGIDKEKRIIDAAGRRPILANILHSEVETFRSQVQLVQMLGVDDPKSIVQKLNGLQKRNGSSKPIIIPKKTYDVETVKATDPKKIILDKAGYFVVYARQDIKVEYYSYRNELLKVIVGKDARSIYHTIIKNKWVSDLSHAAYIGKELAKAELSIKHGFEYLQDGA